MSDGHGVSFRPVVFQNADPSTLIAMLADLGMSAGLLRNVEPSGWGTWSPLDEGAVSDAINQTMLAQLFRGNVQLTMVMERDSRFGIYQNGSASLTCVDSDVGDRFANFLIENRSNTKLLMRRLDICGFSYLDLIVAISQALGAGSFGAEILPDHLLNLCSPTPRRSVIAPATALFNVNRNAIAFLDGKTKPIVVASPVGPLMPLETSIGVVHVAPELTLPGYESYSK